LDPVTRTHPLVVDHISDLGDVPKTSSNVRAEDEALLVLLRKLSKTFSTRDLIEEFVACGCFPVMAGWTISTWLAEDLWIDGIPVPDFAAVFSLQALVLGFLLRRCTARCVTDGLCIFGNVGVDPAVIESRADEMVGSSDSFQN